MPNSQNPRPNTPNQSENLQAQSLASNELRISRNSQLVSQSRRKLQQQKQNSQLNDNFDRKQSKSYPVAESIQSYTKKSQQKNLSEQKYADYKTHEQKNPPKIDRLPKEIQDEEKLQQLEDKVSQMKQNEKIQQVVLPKCSWYTEVSQPDYPQCNNIQSKKPPYQTLVPSSEYSTEQEEENNEQEISFTLDDTQRRITEYISNKSAVSRQNANQYKIIVKQATPQKCKGQKQNSSFHKNNDIYGVQSEIQEQQSELRNTQLQENFNRENQKNRQVSVNQSIQIDIDGPLRKPNQEKNQNIDTDILIDGPLSQTQRIKQSSIQQNNKENNERQNFENNQSNRANRISQFLTNQSTSADNQNRFQVEGNIVIRNISQSQSQTFRNQNQDVEIDGNRTQNKKKQEKQLTFWYTKNKEVIYTEQCYKQPLSGQNKRAYVSQFQTVQQRQQRRSQMRKNMQRESQHQNNQNSIFSTKSKKEPKVQTNKQNNDTAQRRKTNHPVRTVFYRKQEELNQILEYFDLTQKITDGQDTVGRKKRSQNQQQKQEKLRSETKSQMKLRLKKQSEDVEIDGPRTPKIEVQLGVITSKTMRKKTQIEQQQIQINQALSFVDRPHPVFAPEYRNPSVTAAQNQVPTPTSQKRKVGEGKVTKRKQFFKGTTSSKRSQQNSIIRKQKQQGNQSKRKNVSFDLDPTGSVFHYELIPQRNSNRKNLVQVRRSGRIFSKSKKMLQDLQKVEEQQQIQIDGKVNRQKIEEKQERTKQKQKALGNSTKSKALQKSQPKPQQQQNEEITLDWLKEHISQLNEYVVESVYMYNEYRAMTEQDMEISRFLYSLQEKADDVQKIERDDLVKVEYNNRNDQFNDQQNQSHQIRQNQMMRPSQKNAQEAERQNRLMNVKTEKKKSKKKSKGKSKGKINVKKQSTEKRQNMSKNKIQKTLEISVNPQQKQQQSAQQQNEAHYNDLELGDYHEVKQKIQQGGDQNSQSRMRSGAQNSQAQRMAIFKQNKDKYKVPDEFPLTIQSIVDPDILNLGIYALVKLGRLSQFQLGTQYAITPICEMRYARKRDVLLVLAQSKSLVPEQYLDNIALVALNTKLLRLIEKATDQKKKKQTQNRNNNQSKQK